MEFVTSDIAEAAKMDKPLWFVVLPSGRCIASCPKGIMKYYMSMGHMDYECGSNLDEYEPIFFPAI